jgi:serine protease Do
VEPKSPSDRAGLKRRDIIVRMNGQPIETARQFENEIYLRPGSERIKLDIQRGQEQLSIPVEVHEQSAPWDILAELVSPEKNLIPRLGILCVEIDAKIAAMIPDLRRQYGLIVAAKSSEGQGQFIDLQSGDIIHAVNNLPVATLAAFQEAIHQLKPGDPVVLQIERQERFRYIAFELE